MAVNPVTEERRRLGPAPRVRPSDREDSLTEPDHRGMLLAARDRQVTDAVPVPEPARDPIGDPEAGDPYAGRDAAIVGPTVQLEPADDAGRPIAGVR